MRLAVIVLAIPAVAAAQSPQYRSPAGVAYVSQRDTGAVARLQAALAADPRNVGLMTQLAVAHAQVRQYREAIVVLSRGIQVAPNDPILYRYRGHRYISVREFDSALADLTRGNRLDTANYDIWYHLGVVRFVRGDFAGAATAFGRAQAMAPNDDELAGSTDWLWMSLRRSGRSREEARVAFARLHEGMRPRITTAVAYMKRLDLYQGYAGVDTLIGRADTSDIQVATLNYGIGNWYLVNGDTAKARLHFQRSVASGGWPAFGFIAAEVELRRLPAAPAVAAPAAAPAPAAPAAARPATRTPASPAPARRPRPAPRRP